MQKLGGRIASFCKFWWRDQSKILSFCNAKIRGEVCEFLQNLGGGIISAKNLKVKSASRGKTWGGLRVCANFCGGIISATILKVRSASRGKTTANRQISHLGGGGVA